MDRGGAITTEIPALSSNATLPQLIPSNKLNTFIFPPPYFFS